MARTVPVPEKGFFRYLTSSEEDEKWQVVCTDAGHTEIGPRTVYPPNKDGHPPLFKSVAVGRTLQEYQIIYITEGRGVFQSGRKSFGIEPGTVMIIFPGVRHFYRPDFEIGWTEYWVGFRGDYVDTLCKNGFLTPERPVYRIGLQNTLVAIYDEIFELVRNQQPLYQIRASTWVLALIAEVLAQERRKAQHSHSQQLVERAKFLMEESIYGDINVNLVAAKLGVSTSHLNEVFKAYTSMTPYQYFISIKVQKAKELLNRGELAIKEVAFKLGFRDQYYFSRLFKRKTGVSPSRWSAFAHR